MKKNLFLLVITLFIPIIGWAVEQGYAVFDSETGTLTFKYGDKPEGENIYDTDYTRFNCYDPPTWDCSKIKKVIFDPSYANARPTSISFWFEMATSLTDIVDIKYLNTSEVTNMWRVFGHCRGLTSLDLSHFDTRKVTRMSEMFSKCTNLKSLDISSFNTSKVELMEMMFADCNSLISLDVSHFDTQNVTEMDLMFFNCSSLTNLDVSSFNTSNVESMRAMFGGCSSLTSLDVSHFDTGKVPDMSDMFAWCSKLLGLDVSHFNTSHVTNMGSMFYSCKSLRELDLSSFDTGEVTDMSSMFSNCDILESIYVSDNWTTANVTSGDGVFYRCDRLIGGMGTTAHNSEQTDYTYAGIDGGPDAPGYLTDIADRIVGDQGYAVFDSEAGTLTFMYGEMPEGVNVFHTDHTRYSWDVLPYWDCGQIKEVIFDPSFANARPKSTSCWFMDANSLSEIAGIEYLNTSNVTDMSCMFQGCWSLTNLDLSTFNTGNVTDMKSMFSWSGINKINLSHFDTRNVVNMFGMFSDCSGLTCLDLGSFDTGNVTNMESMFFNCSNLEIIYAGDKWSTASVTEGEYVFYDCEKLVGGMGTAYRDAYIYDNQGNYLTYLFARIDGGEDAPGYFTKKLADGETVLVTISQYGKTTFCSNYNLDFSQSEAKAYVATGYEYQGESSTIWMTRVKDVPARVPVMIKGTANETYHVPVTEGGSSYYKNMFVGNTTGESMSIGETSEDGQYVNYYMSGGQFKSVSTSANIGNNKCYLQLPANFAAEATGDGYQVKIAASGKSSFAAPYDLDFTSLNDDVKAFTATGYDAGTKTIWLTRVKKVQKGEGLLLKGTGGETYTIPSSGVQAAYENMIVGNIGEEITINGTSEDGTLTNYYLKGGTYMSVSGSANIGTNKSYLQLPTSMLAGATGARSEDAPYSSDVLGTQENLGYLGNLGIPSTCHLAELETESMPIVLGETTGVKDNNRETITNNRDDQWFTISGQRIDKPTKKGLYIHDGRKVVVR